MAAPIFKDIMAAALGDKPAIPFRIPSGVRLVRVAAATGLPAKPGDVIDLYTGMRTKQCRRLARVECIEVVTFRIDRVGGKAEVRVRSDPADAEAQARADGFENSAAMLDWFEETHGLPFRGLLIR